MEAADEYAEQLTRLVSNKLSLIQSLTTIAGENRHMAHEIARVILRRIEQAPPEQKIPPLYLLDSITKNIGPPFLDCFAPQLVRTFTTAFEAADPARRKSLVKLLNTWPTFYPKQFRQLQTLAAASQTGPPSPGPARLQPRQAQFGDAAKVRLQPRMPGTQIPPRPPSQPQQLIPNPGLAGMSHMAIEPRPPLPPNLGMPPPPPDWPSGGQIGMGPGNQLAISTLAGGPSIGASGFPLQVPLASPGGLIPWEDVTKVAQALRPA